MMSSFNPLNHNVRRQVYQVYQLVHSETFLKQESCTFYRRDALICIIADTSMSLLGSLVAFMFVGHVYVLKREPLPDHFPGILFCTDWV